MTSVTSVTAAQQGDQQQRTGALQQVLAFALLTQAALVVPIDIWASKFRRAFSDLRHTLGGPLFNLRELRLDHFWLRQVHK